MKKQISKLLALFMSISMLPLAGVLPASAAAGTAAGLTQIVEYNGQDGTLPTVVTIKAIKHIIPINIILKNPNISIPPL